LPRHGLKLLPHMPGRYRNELGWRRNAHQFPRTRKGGIDIGLGDFKYLLLKFNASMSRFRISSFDPAWGLLSNYGGPFNRSL
jgi:hypothetical protein